MDLYRSNAIRVLCNICDSQTLASIERYLKQAVVDKGPVVASAVLVSAMHLLSNNSEIVKRWTNEIQEAAQSKQVRFPESSHVHGHQHCSSSDLALPELQTSTLAIWNKVGLPRDDDKDRAPSLLKDAS